MPASSIVDEIWNYALGIIGAVLGAASVIVFLVPFDIAPSGLSGVAVILNELIGTPIGLVTLLLNIPVMILAWRLLPHGSRIVGNTVVILVVYTAALDLLAPLMGDWLISDDRLLNALFGGVTGGLAGGLIYRSGASFGGTSTIALIVQRYTGMSMSSVFLYTDTLIIAGAGLVYGIEGALYALVVLFITGVATDYVMEGPSVIRTVFIITDQPDAVARSIMEQMNRGVTMLPARGMYTGRERAMLYVTITRPQATEIVQVVHQADAEAFVVVGQGHSAYGHGFRVQRHKKAGSAVLPVAE